MNKVIFLWEQKSYLRIKLETTLKINLMINFDRKKPTKNPSCSITVDLYISTCHWNLELWEGGSFFHLIFLETTQKVVSQYLLNEWMNIEVLFISAKNHLEKRVVTLLIPSKQQCPTFQGFTETLSPFFLFSRSSEC